MITQNWSGIKTWTADLIMAYNAEQQTLLMQKMANSLDWIERIAVNRLEDETDQRKISDLAVSLMVERDTVIRAFNGFGCIPLSVLRQRLTSSGIRAWGDDLLEAIPKTDYLVIEPTGRGYRAWLAEDYAAAKGAAS